MVEGYCFALRLSEAWALGEDAEAGAYIAPGLPNIIGTASYNANTGFVGAFGDLSSVTGAFKLGKQFLAFDVAGAYQGYALELDASSSNAIYGSSSTVMPSSVNAPVILYLGRPK